MTITKGEYLTIVGPNGAGKTTLLRCIDRIIENWSGNVILNNVSIRRISRKTLSRQIAYIQQNASIPPFTVGQYVALCRYPHLSSYSLLTSNDYAVVEDALQEMHAEMLIHRPMKTLSGGECQKVLLAAAVAQETDILLLDEPTVYLDYRHQEEMADFLLKINRTKGTTIIEVTHDLNHAVLHSSHLVALKQGTIVFDGPPKEMIDRRRLKEIYSVDLQTVFHPEKNLPMIVPYR